MKKIFLVVAGLVIFSLALSWPLISLAATLDFNAETSITLPSGKNLTISNGSLAQSIVINDDSSMTVSLAADSNITFSSTEGWRFSTSPQNNADSCSGTTSSVTLVSATSQDVTLQLTGDRCSLPGSGGGGGGGGGGGTTTVVVPTNTSVLINSGDAETESTSVTLTLGATNAATMLVANKADFSDASAWENYTTSKTWTLTSGLGTKNVYAKFRSSGGGESAVVTDAITLAAPAEAVSGTVSSESGGSASLENGKVLVTVPAGAVTGSGTVTITPSSSYTAPTGNNKVVGSKAYDLSLTVGTSEVATFNELVTLTFTYTDNDIAGVDESTLAIHYWNETSQQWLNLGGTIDQANNTITVTVAHFTQFAVIGEILAASGDLIKLECATNASVNDPCKAVYYLAKNGKRYVFPHEKTFKTWYDDFSTVKIVSASEMASYMIGGNVTYRPGVKLVKIQTDPKVYAVNKNGALSWVATAAIAESLYGASWASQIDDIPDAFFVNYHLSSDIDAVADYDKEAVKNASPDINTDKGL